MSYLNVTLYVMEGICEDAIRPYGVCRVPLYYLYIATISTDLLVTPKNTLFAFQRPSAEISFVQVAILIILVTTSSRKFRLIESNAKCRHLKKFTCKWTLRQVFICLRPLRS
jgi:hypothetical protein